MNTLWKVYVTCEKSIALTELVHPPGLEPGTNRV